MTYIHIGFIISISDIFRGYKERGEKVNLQHSRNNAGLTQEGLAHRLGLKRITIARYENGTRRPSPEIATRIGEVLGLSKEELWEMFYDKDSKEQTSHDKPADLPDP